MIKNIDQHPDVAPHIARYAEVTTEKQELVREQRDLSAKLNSIRYTGEENPIDWRAREIAFGVSEKPVDPLVVRLSAITAKIRELQAASDLLLSTIDTARMRASAEICKSKGTEHKAVEAKFAKAMVAATEAAIDYHEYIEQFENAGVRTTALDHNLPHYLEALSHHGMLARWLRESVQRGVIKMSDVPARLDWTR